MSVKRVGKSITEIILKQYPFFKEKIVIEVGIPVGAKEPDGTPTANVAFWNEYGTATIPARPAFRTTIAQNAQGWTSHFAYIFQRSNFNIDTACEALGALIQGQLKESINNWSDPPNAASTIKKKGFNKSLIDTGTMLKSIEWNVKKQ